MKIHININIKVNKIVKYFILVDLVLLAGWGLIEPIFSIFVLKQVAGATLVTVGTAAAIYWLLKSALQLPFANIIDHGNTERRTLYALMLGLVIAGVSAFSLVVVSTPLELYLVQIIHAVGFALYVATWPALFSRHLDKDRVSFDWALDSTAAGISAGITAFLGSVIANRFGFSFVFILAGVASLASAMVLFLVPTIEIPGATAPSSIKDHTPANIGY